MGCVVLLSFFVTSSALAFTLLVSHQNHQTLSQLNWYSQFSVPKNGDEDLSESDDDVLCLIPDVADGACDRAKFGDGVYITMWQSSLLCNVKYEIHML